MNARGGVYGRKIRYRYLDDRYDPAITVADERRLISADNVFAVFNAFGVITHKAVVRLLNKDGVPDLFVGSSCACWNAPLRYPDTFGFGTNYAVEGRLMGHFVARSFPTAKIAYIWEADACCRESVSELDQEISSHEVVTRQRFTIDDLVGDRLLPQVKAAQDAGAHLLVLDTLAPAAVAEVLLDAEALAYHPVIVDTFRLSADPAVVAQWLSRLAPGGGAVALEDGLITQDYLPSASARYDPWIRLFRRIHDVYEPGTQFDNMTVYGMAAAYSFIEALDHAGRYPTRRSIVAAIEAGAANAPGPALVGLRDSRRDHDGYPGEQIGRIENGKLLLSGPLYETGITGPVTAHRIARTPIPHWLLG